MKIRNSRQNWPSDSLNSIIYVCIFPPNENELQWNMNHSKCVLVYSFHGFRNIAELNMKFFDGIDKWQKIKLKICIPKRGYSISFFRSWCWSDMCRSGNTVWYAYTMVFQLTSLIYKKKQEEETEYKLNWFALSVQSILGKIWTMAQWIWAHPFEYTFLHTYTHWLEECARSSFCFLRQALRYGWAITKKKKLK